MYHSNELELLAVVETIKRFRVYLVGIHFNVTDCSAVTATMAKKDVVQRVRRDGGWYFSSTTWRLSIDRVTK